MIKQVITKGRVPVKMWLDDCESGAIEQAINLSNLPFVYKHVALMPDAHQGYGMPIGGVIACDGMVIPNAVGVDIGCGMAAMKTDITDIKRIDLMRICAEIQQRIPVGFKHHSDAQELPSDLDTYVVSQHNFFSNRGVVIEEYAKSKRQLGTLGGGNHFIEIQKDEDGFIWIMIHSGSRNVGHKIATYYNKLAKDLNDKWGITIPKSHQLAYLPMSCEEASAYMAEMGWAVRFAKCNRAHMMNVVGDIFQSYFQCSFQPPLDVAHNYARKEVHYGKEVIVHRKGATSADKDELGIIPGSQGSSSFIVRGKGNKLSFKSCSHGAGRRMSRTAAREVLNIVDEARMMDEAKIVHNLRSRKQLDEAPSAYKDINVVMENQSDLVGIVHELTPLAVVKG